MYYGTSDNHSGTLKITAWRSSITYFTLKRALVSILFSFVLDITAKIKIIILIISKFGTSKLTL